MNKKFVCISIIVIILMIGPIFVNGKQINSILVDDSLVRDRNWFENNPDSLPIWLTQEELKLLDEIGEGFERTSAPPAPVRMPAEFEPMQGVLIRYPFGISYQIIAEMSEGVEVVTIVASSSEQNYVTSQYQSHGVNMNNIDFLIAPSDSYWTRDYGPWFIFSGNDEQGITDFIYNRPRPNDNQIPSKFGIWQGIPIYGMGIEHTGGNYMTDGQGIAVSTDIVWSENPGYSHSQIAEIMEDYCGISTYHVVPDPNNEYIDHVDCWGKYLSPDTILIREVPPSHSQYSEIESTADYFESQISCYGTPYNIVRVYTPNNQPYTNSLILNDKVLVPITGSQWDDEAIDSYEAAMPGYEVLGFTGSWVSTDALHCRAKGIVDRGMLYIQHTPLFGNHTSHCGFEIQAMIYPYSGENINTAEILIRIDGGSWQNFNMEYMGGNMYNYFITPPPESTVTIDYYIHAEDSSGRSEYHPYIGAPMTHSFIGIVENHPPEIINITGPSSGVPGTEYDCCINLYDQDEDDLYVFWDWGDGDTTGWLGPFEYVEEICASHVWDSKSTYTVKVKIKDVCGVESDWAELEVNMPRNKIFSYRLISLLFQRISTFLLNL